MAEINGVAETQAAVVQSQRPNTERQAPEDQNDQDNSLSAVSDQTTISSEGLELSQAVRAVEQPAEQNDVEQQPQNQDTSGDEEAVPRFLDIRA